MKKKSKGKKKEMSKIKLLYLIITLFVFPVLVYIIGEIISAQTNAKIASKTDIEVYANVSSITDYPEKNKIAIFYAQLTENEKSYNDECQVTYNRACLINILFTNKSENDIVLTQFSCIANNIVVDETPVILKWIYCYDDNLYVDLINNGWGNAENFQIRMFNDDLYDFIGNNEIIFSSDDVIPGFFEPLGFCLSHSDLDTSNLANGEVVEIALEGEYTYKGLSEPVSIEPMPVLFISNKSLKSDLTSYGGADSDMKYGIIINTLKVEDSYNIKTKQVVPAHETVLLPVCIAADRSCTFDLEISFEINYNKKISINPLLFKNLSIFVPYYCMGDDYLIYDGDEIDNDTDFSEATVYFPYKMVESVFNGD